ALEENVAGADGAPVDRQQAADRADRRGLAGAVRPEQRHDPTLRHGERDAAKRERDVAVEHLKVVDHEEPLRPGAGGAGLRCRHGAHDVYGHRTNARLTFPQRPASPVEAKTSTSRMITPKTMWV